MTVQDVPRRDDITQQVRKLLCVELGGSTLITKAHSLILS